MEEGDHGDGSLIAKHFRVGEPRGIVDANVNVLPSSSSRSVATVAGDPVTDPLDSTEFLHVHVDQLSRPRALVADRWLSGSQITKSAQASS